MDQNGCRPKMYGPKVNFHLFLYIFINFLTFLKYLISWCFFSLTLSQTLIPLGTSDKKIGVNALFVPIFWDHFYFDPYISILPFLVSNSINACYFSHFRHLTNRKN